LRLLDAVHLTLMSNVVNCTPLAASDEMIR
jgi:hypothetical protein